MTKSLIWQVIQPKRKGEKMESIKVPTTISIEYSLLEKIDKERRQKDISRSELLREIIKDHYERSENV